MAAQSTQNTPWNNPPALDEDRWVVQIRHFLEEENEDDDIGVPVSISNVPKQLIAATPEAYIPQEVALGPYHHWRPELYEMERYKIAAAKRTQKRLNGPKFQSLVDRFVKLEPMIRSCYHRYLDYSGETLAWMMAVDASFLIEFLWIFTAKDDRSGVLERLSFRMSHLVDYSGTRSAHNAILRDIMMLENQIPLFLLRKTLESQSSSVQKSDEQLTRIVTGLCRELSPFKATRDWEPHIQVTERAHLLELLYYLIVPKSEQPDLAAEPNEQYVTIEVTIDESMANEGYVPKFLERVWQYLSSLNPKPVRLIKEAFACRPMRFVVKLPWTVLTKLPVFSLLKLPVEYLFKSPEKDDAGKKEDDGSPSSRQPSIEEISIPSVSELVQVGVKFSATGGDLSTIRFDEKAVTFYLPTVTLDVNTEVILRNLVSFEAAVVSSPLVFTRYTELMNGIIDTEEDVKVLREKGVVANCLKSDGEAASLWNGMSKSVRLTKVPQLDKVIEDVNRYYSSRWRVKVGKFMKAYVFGSWQFLTFLAAILLLILTGLDAFCSVYTCARWFDVSSDQR